jgi:hypothetical protein
VAQISRANTALAADAGQQEASREDVLAPVVFRAVNDRISELLDKNGGIEARATELRDFICECRNRDCTSTVRATAAEFDAIRAGEKLFLVDPNHRPEAPDRLVRTTRRFRVFEARELVQVGLLADDNDTPCASSPEIAMTRPAGGFDRRATPT